ncbi:MAG: hypothetical protein U1E36_00010 [Rickettsiales bacterium]
MENEKITDPRSPTYAPDDDNIKRAGGNENPAPLEVPNEEKTPAEIPEKS